MEKGFAITLKIIGGVGGLRIEKVTVEKGSSVKELLKRKNFLEDAADAKKIRGVYYKGRNLSINEWDVAVLEDGQEVFVILDLPIVAGG